MREAMQLPNGLKVAPLWRRAAAALIDLLAVCTGLALAAGAAFAAIELTPLHLPDLLRGPLKRRYAAATKPADHPKARPQPSARKRLLISVPSLVLTLDGRNRLGLGRRVMRIRRVDIHTGGPITVRAELTCYLVASAYGLATKEILAPITKRSRSRMEDLRAELGRLDRVHAGNRKALEEARFLLYQEHNVNPLSSCLGPSLFVVVARAVPMLRSPLRQGLPDRAAGIVTVVVDRPAPAVGASTVAR